MRAILSIVLLILFLFGYKTFWHKCERIGIGKFSISFWAIVGGGLLALAFLEALDAPRVNPGILIIFGHKMLLSSQLAAHQ